MMVSCLRIKDCQNRTYFKGKLDELSLDLNTTAEGDKPIFFFLRKKKDKPIFF